ncbi:hypothetical protein GCM10010988_25240 [Cnuibacter physcomitrellae]|nr:hypothetical protein GCM10010988_25240 [Cnuibacter physcomitrellae]
MSDTDPNASDSGVSEREITQANGTSTSTVTTISTMIEPTRPWPGAWPRRIRRSALARRVSAAALTGCVPSRRGW